MSVIPGQWWALTANAMADDRQRCLTAGCNGFITKPIRWTAFWATVRRFVNEMGEARARAGGADPGVMDSDAEAFTHAAREELAHLTAMFADALPRRVTEIGAAFHRQDRIQMRLLSHSHALAGAAAS